jgi:predicted aconitase with swiveling domain
VKALALLPGSTRGPVLRLDRPLSFWGGVDPASGRLLSGPGESIAGAVLMVPEAIGSSSSGAVLLELLRNGMAPAALVLGRIDAILGLGILAAGEMGWPTIPLVILAAADQTRFETGEMVEIDSTGLIEPAGMVLPTHRP